MNTSCPLCLQKDSTKIETRESHSDSGITYTLHWCHACDGQFWTPLKNPGATWYERDVRYSFRNGAPLLDPNWNHKKVISYLKPMIGKVFDIGCGTGNFLAHAKRKGWQAFGIDFDRDAVRVANTTFGLPNVEVNDLGGFIMTHPKSQFDLVTFFDVFEHVDNHIQFISEVRSLVKPGGYIAMSMPYRHGARWLLPHDLPPRHLTRWDRGALSHFLEQHGFTVRYIARRTEGVGFIVLKLRFRYGARFSFNLVGKTRSKDQRHEATKSSESPKSAGHFPQTKESRKVRIVTALAKAKDWIIFGIPACVIWLCMIPSRKRYITLYAIAQKHN